MKLNAILSLLGRFEKPIVEYIRRDRMPGALLCAGNCFVYRAVVANAGRFVVRDTMGRPP